VLLPRFIGRILPRRRSSIRLATRGIFAEDWSETMSGMSLNQWAEEAMERLAQADPVGA